ncbi:MAG TPA: response regulator [Vicinamibacterales bacterium]|nr:response regulator [Vicinamibacterales bacterium]
MSRTLLLADGSVTVQRVIELTFAHEDIRVTAVSDGRKAIQILDNEQPDVVLADIDLPEVDGYQLAAHMRRVPRLKNVPLLLLAGAFEPVDQQRARDVGSDGVIVKPFEPQVVVTRVKELIDQRDRASQPMAKKEEVAAEAAPGPKAVPPPAPPPAAPAPEPARQASRPEPAFPRPAAAPEQPVPEPLADLPAVPEPLELPSRPIWDIRGSVAQGPAPLPPLTLPGQAAALPSVAPVMPVAAAPLPPVAPAPALPSTPPPPKVTLANAFTALLAAEQSMPPAAAPVAMTEASIEDAVRRVLVRMTDDLVRRIVVDTAERLIREEIERIKATPD